MRSAAAFMLLAITLGLSSACGAAPERQIAAANPPGPPLLPPLPTAGPVFAAGDSDRDGVLDPYDACPGLPGVPSRVVVLNGCPPPGYYDDALGTHDRDADFDGDGVPDATDVCRNDPGPARDDVRATGCPAAWVEGDRVRILEQVRFASGSADLLPESTPVLEAIVTVLARRTDITKVRVEGHTDGRGGAVMNRRLSLGRATSVARFLTDHGVLGTRVDAQGIGPDRPIDTNETEPGRATNRRVEFHVLGVTRETDARPKTGLSVAVFPALDAAPPSSPPVAPSTQAATPDSSGL